MKRFPDFVGLVILWFVFSITFYIIELTVERLGWIQADNVLIYAFVASVAWIYIPRGEE